MYIAQCYYIKKTNTRKIKFCGTIIEVEAFGGMWGGEV